MLLHCLSWSQAVWAFLSTVLCSGQREIPAGFLGFGGSVPMQGFSRGGWTEQSEPFPGCYISLFPL